MTNLETSQKKTSLNNANTAQNVNQVNNTLSLTQNLMNDFDFNKNELSPSSLIKDYKTKIWFITIRNSYPVNIHGTSNVVDESPYLLVHNNETIQLTLNPFELSKIQKYAQFIPNNLNIMNQLSLAKQDR
jgi:hypothetical protein